ncbi:hypothetical protein HPB48_000486 [Haemaphysalis longicornis]|uniref:Nuclease HARBI1 n=1 Tax=Haemaphysalis longicornis TaxID=44386 RepID=A0A9J6GRT0_HAELO|nr:hypothetical protein HPB48_000486 [Haemaphysalis longicornis]
MSVPCLVALIEWELDQRVYRLHKVAFLLSADAFQHQHRLTKALVHWLCERLRGELTCVQRSTASSLPVELNVLCVLRFFATGSFQGMMATHDHLATTQFTVSRCIRAVAQAI